MDHRAGGAREHASVSIASKAFAAFRLRDLSGAALVALSALVRAQPAVERDAGKAVFEHWCAPCHAPGPRHPGTQALQALYGGAKPAALEERDDLVPDLTRAFVRSGVSIMPPFRKTEISDVELEALARYLAR